MLLFIPFCLRSLNGCIIFQNISCCYLSEARLTAAQRSAYFKTSHVAIYLLVPHRSSDYLEFQNISCCYLSLSHFLYFSLLQISKHLMLLFITGADPKRKIRIRISKHLMLLFIGILGAFTVLESGFQNISCCYLSEPEEVEEDEWEEFQNISCCYLSIVEKTEQNTSIIFQNISCCYLSDIIFL